MKTLIIALSGLLLASGCTEQLRRAGIDENQVQAISNVATTLSRPDYTPAEEAQIGQLSAATLLGAAPLIADRETMQYINQLGGWIARQTGRNDINWRFGVINSSNVNAFAAPDGYVFVTKGLLRTLNDESELAGVVAHEIAHVIKRHYLVAVRKKDTTNALANVAVTTAQKGGVKNADILAGPLANIVQNLYASGLDKGDEYEADRLGVVYATRAGYDPYGLPRVLNLYAQNANSNGFDLLFSTHPSPQDRLQQLGKAMGERLAAYETDKINNTAFLRIKRKAVQLPDPKS
ncbi:M48 family metalloprotease [Azonexus hydrophilus]|uniref:M48 family metalloprotease n=1 Tax=Azonexus hydrophilus TaxID=418702 RepID=A0ABZ2XKD5_9RHOO|nr:M48 family metalloprotease [Azonexus hydrophilus]